MDRFWLPQYPPSVPADIDPFEIDSLKSLIEDACVRYADRIAYHSMGTSITYCELEVRSRAFGAWLQHSAGLKSGDRISIMLPNLLQFPIAMFGALRAGLTVVNTNPLYTVPELQHQLQDSGAAAAVVLENFAATLQQALPDTRVRQVVVTGVGDMLNWPKGAVVNFALRHLQKKVPSWMIPAAHSFRQVIEQGRGLRLLPVNLDRDDLA